MPESQRHMDYVNLIYNYIYSIVPEAVRSFIEVDSPVSNCKPTRTLNNFIPDVLLDLGDYYVIGEAKTSGDVNHQHSIRQYVAYLMACDKRQGESFIVVCVSWDTFVSAKNLFRRLKKETGVKKRVIVLSENGEVNEV